MNANNYIGTALEELYRVFDILNAKYYANKLPSPIITIQRGFSSDNLGWCSNDKIWVQKNGTEQTQKYEINLTAEYLSNTGIEIVHTLLHEMVHYAANCEGIKTTSGKIHNKLFKERAEAIGFEVEKQPKVGWGVTHLTKNIIDFIMTSVKIDESKFEYFRTRVEAPVKEKKPNENKLMKYICPQCQEMVKAKKDAQILCGRCNCVFELEEVEE